MKPSAAPKGSRLLLTPVQAAPRILPADFEVCSQVFAAGGRAGCSKHFLQRGLDMGLSSAPLGAEKPK